MASLLFFFGVLVGCLLFGDLGDRSGRKSSFFVSVLLIGTFGVAAAFSPEHYSFSIFRSIVAMATSGIYIAGFVLAIELVSPSHRVFVAAMVMVSFTSGYLFISILAIIIPNWRYIQLALSVLGIIMFSYWWIVPESPRWQLIKAKKKELISNIYGIAKFNKVALVKDVNLFIEKSVDANRRAAKASASKVFTIAQLFWPPETAKFTLVTIFNWLLFGALYYNFAKPCNHTLSSDINRNLMIMAAIEAPSFLVSALMLNKFGRNITSCILLILVGMVSLLVSFVTRNNNVHDDFMDMFKTGNQAVPLVILAMIGKGLMSATGLAFQLHTAECYPTTLRCFALGFAIFISKLGAMIMSFVSKKYGTHYFITYIVLGIGGFVMAALVLTLPEMAQVPLIDRPRNRRLHITNENHI